MAGSGWIRGRVIRDETSKIARATKCRVLQSWTLPAGELCRVLRTSQVIRVTFKRSFRCSQLQSLFMTLIFFKLHVLPTKFIGILTDFTISENLVGTGIFVIFHFASRKHTVFLFIQVLYILLWNFADLFCIFSFYLFERVRDHPATNSLPKCLQEQQGWTRLKPLAQNSICVSRLSGRNPSTWTITCCLLECVH